MTSASPFPVPLVLPRQRSAEPDVEREVARTADLVLKLSALADRYESTRADPQRVARMRAAVERGLHAVDDVAEDE